MDSLLPLSLLPSIHLLSSSLSNTPSFIFFFSLQVSSSWLLFPTPAANPVASSLSSWTSFFIVKRSWRVLTSFFNGCYTSYGQTCHSLPSLSLLCFLSTLLFYFVTHLYFFFPIQVSSLSSQDPVVSSPSLFGLCCHVGLNFPAIFQTPRPH